MPTHARLRALVTELRHAPTRLMPIEIAERVQHTIVRIEALLESPVIDSDALETLQTEAKLLLAESDAFISRL